MKKFRPNVYILILIGIFIIIPAILLLIIHFVFDESINLFENFYLIIFYAMPLVGFIAFVQQDIYIGVDEMYNLLINNVTDPRPDWNWQRGIKNLIEIEYIRSKSISRSIFGKKFLFYKVLMFKFVDGEIQYISVSLFTNKQITAIQLLIKDLMNKI